MINVRYHQVFHAISNNSEINLFFGQLKKQFLINESLRDIQESIDSLDQIIKEERNSKLTIVLFILTFLGFFSAINDMMDLYLK